MGHAIVPAVVELVVSNVAVGNDAVAVWLVGTW